MEPEKRKRVEDEFIIIDEQEELRKVTAQAELKAEESLNQMTDVQLTELRSQRASQWYIALSIAALIVAVIIFLWTPDPLGLTRAIAWLLVVVSVIVMGYGLLKRSQIDSDLRSSRIDYLEGIISLHNRRAPHQHLFLSIAGDTFEITESMFLSLSNHQPYRVFYAPQSPRGSWC
ncbi:MAG: hypothetical protein U0694_02040 [Anaerolineae bacterium]